MGFFKWENAFKYAQNVQIHIILHITSLIRASALLWYTVEPRYLELSYFELLLISKWKSGPCFNMELWQQVTK